jgi:hypothetical protein
MEPITQTPQTPPKTSLADLFKPLEPTSSTAAPGQQEAANNATPGGSAAQASAASSPGTISMQEALSGSNHTTISDISGQSANSAPGGPVQTPGASVSLGGMVQGEWVVNIIDALLPAAIVAAFYAMGVKIRKTEMQLTAGEKNTLAPLVQKCMDSMLINFTNPWNALGITMLAIYGGKIMEKGLVAWIDKKQEKQEQEVLKSKIETALRQNDPVNDSSNQSSADIIAGKVVTPNDQLPFTEDEVRATMKSRKMGREKAIEALKRKYKV